MSSRTKSILRDRCDIVILSACVTPLLLASGTVASGELRLSDLGSDDRVAIQRGYSMADGACALNLINEIEAYGGPDAMDEFTIEFEQSPLIIQNAKARITHTCENGLHTMDDNGSVVVLQQYDENGQPTMMEP